MGTEKVKKPHEEFAEIRDQMKTLCAYYAMERVDKWELQIVLLSRTIAFKAPEIKLYCELSLHCYT